MSIFSEKIIFKGIIIENPFIHLVAIDKSDLILDRMIENNKRQFENYGTTYLRIKNKFYIF